MRARPLSIVFGLGLLLHAAPGRADSAATASAADDATPAAEDAAPTVLGWSGAFDVAVASRYLFQGIDYSDGRSVLQPNAVMSRGAWSAVLWANYQPNLGGVNEVDASFKFTHEFGRLTVSPGYTYLRYPNRDWLPTHELTADLSVAAALSPTLSVHQDIAAGDGTYATLGVSRTVAGALALASNMFYQSHYYGLTGVPAVELRAGTSFSYGGMSLAPAVSYFATRRNRDFTGAAAIPAGWLVAVDVARKP